MFRETNLKCPCCGGNIIDNGRTFQCEHVFPDKECEFTVWQESHYREEVITEDMLEDLLDGESVILTQTSKGGNEYKAEFTLNFENGKLEFKNFVNDNK